MITFKYGIVLETYDGYTKGFIVWEANIGKDKIYFDRYKLMSGFGQGKLDMEFVRTDIKVSKLVWPE